jgi:hypothetical protein
MQKASKRVVEVYEMMKDGKSVNFDAMVKRLGCKAGTAMVLICALRRSFGADIETERDGRKVISYRLTNASDIASRMVLTKSTKAKAPKVASVKVAKTKSTVSRKSSLEDGEVPTVESDYDISEVSDAELADLKLQLGLG